MKSREFKRGPVTIWGELLNFDKISIMVDYLAMAILTKSKYRELIMLHNFIILQSTSHLHSINFQNTTGKRKIICFITVSSYPLLIAPKNITNFNIHTYLFYIQHLGETPCLITKYDIQVPGTYIYI